MRKADMKIRDISFAPQADTKQLRLLSQEDTEHIVVTSPCVRSNSTTNVPMLQMGSVLIRYNSKTTIFGFLADTQ